MLKKLTSVDELNKADILLDSSNPEKAIQYLIKNTGHGYVYAIHEDENIDLRVITSHDQLNENWRKEEL